MRKIEYKIIRTKSISGSVGIKIKNGEVVVRAPFWVPKIFIENFVTSKENWIESALAKESSKAPDKKYFDGENHLLFGVEHKLELKFSSAPTVTKVAREDSIIKVTIFDKFSANQRAQEVKDALLRFYLEVGIGYLTEKVNYYSSLLGVEYSKVEIKKVSSIWGSCSSKNVLSFNRKLVMAPYQIIDYVIIHEVCHLRERNHSSRFWGLVFKYDRDYKQHRLWLHQNSNLLTI